MFLPITKFHSPGGATVNSLVCLRVDNILFICKNIFLYTNSNTSSGFWYLTSAQFSKGYN